MWRVKCYLTMWGLPMVVFRMRLSGALRRFVAVFGAIVLASNAGAYAADLTELSLEELMNVEVTSVAKKAQPLSGAAAAVYVITQEDIRRSGATSIAEAIRMAPGVDVARFDSNKWAISARGFNTLFSNKLLVLIDGRTVYTPLFAGVFWDVQDTLLEDIERIEVIRGPGGTLWGANAVNGVINIITKHAKDTQGGLLTGGGGTEERGFGAARYGVSLGNGVFVRAYAKYFDRSSFETATGDDAADEWDVGRGGFRLDWEPNGYNGVTVQGDVYSGDTGRTIAVSSPAPPFRDLVDDEDEVRGGNILGRWRHDFAPRSVMTLQLYYDRTERTLSLFSEHRDTVDLDWQHRFALGERQEFVWGLGYRFTTDGIRDSFMVSFDPSGRDLDLYSAFVQDEITLFPETLRLTVGSKFEHNDFTGFEFQPSGRLLWTPHARHAIWGAISRAVRTPSRGETDLRFNSAVIPAPDGTLTYVSLFGNPQLDSEELLAYELGYRLQPTPRIYVDLAGFYNDYDDLRVTVRGTPLPESSPSPPHVVVPLQTVSGSRGEAYGVEIAAHWNVFDQWKLAGSYTWFDLDLYSDAGPLAQNASGVEGDSPHNQVNLRSFLDLPGRVELDAMVYYVDNLPNQNVSSYFRTDVRLGWRATDRIDLSLVGQNLNDGRHPEFGGEISGSQASQVPRGGYAQIRWRF
jgi:iron complex outermembrane receptor protein